MRVSESLPIVGLVITVVWCSWELALRIVKPGTYDEIGRAKELTFLDPKLGVDLGIKDIPKVGRVAVVWVGDCSSCSTKGLSQDQIKGACSTNTKVVVLTPLQSMASAYPKLKHVIISNEKRKELNAYFAPRVYIVEDGKFRGAQLLTQSALDVIGGQL